MRAARAASLFCRRRLAQEPAVRRIPKNQSYRSRLILDSFTATDSTAGDGATHESRHDSEPTMSTHDSRVSHDL